MALKSMKNNQMPVSDGFSVEFFKYFWQSIGHCTVRSLNYGYREGEVSVTQRQGVIVCIPKEDKSKMYLKNWRPISLLNVVYKLAFTVIANGLKLFLNSLISPEQSGYLVKIFV